MADTTHDKVWVAIDFESTRELYVHVKNCILQRDWRGGEACKKIINVTDTTRKVITNLYTKTTNSPDLY